MKLPEGYRGVVAEKGDVKTPAPRQPEPEVIDLDQEGGGEDPVPTGTLETKAEFEEVVVWGHETMADVVSDPYVRSMEEWLALADQVTPILVLSSLSWSFLQTLSPRVLLIWLSRSTHIQLLLVKRAEVK